MRLYGTAALALALFAQASASLTFYNSRAALGATDFIDWGQVGPDFTPMSNPYLGTTNLGTAFRLDTADDGLVATEGVSANGGFSFGDRIIVGGFTAGPMSITFAASQMAAGTQIQSNDMGDFDATLSVYNNLDQLLGSFTVSGNNAGGSANTNPFLGVKSSESDIAKMVLSTTNDGDGILINRVEAGPCGAVPEPASMATLGLGVVAVLRRRKKA